MRQPGMVLAMDTGAGVGEEFPIASTDDGGGVLVNFGLLTGREATQAELDRLAHSLHQAGAGPELTLTAARRQDYVPGVEVVAHQVHVVISGTTSAAVVAICEQWARECAEDRSIEPLD